MKLLSVLCLSLLSLQAFATEIEVTSQDCNFEVRKERDGVVLKVNKLIAIQNTISSWDIELPNDKIKLPLQNGLKKTIDGMGDDEITITYKNGILTHDHKAKSNYTRDTLVMHISPDLKSISSAKFTRKGTGILFLFGSEKFDCKF
ncbi:MAG: hypothetical protein V4598_16285 [Bdellovibrionota bacterium]